MFLLSSLLARERRNSCWSQMRSLRVDLADISAYFSRALLSCCAAGYRNAPRRAFGGCSGGEAAGSAAEREVRRTRGASGKSPHANTCLHLPADVLLPLALMQVALALRDKLGKQELESGAPRVGLPQSSSLSSRMHMHGKVRPSILLDACFKFALFRANTLPASRPGIKFDPPPHPDESGPRAPPQAAVSRLSAVLSSLRFESALSAIAAQTGYTLAAHQ